MAPWPEGARRRRTPPGEEQAPQTAEAEKETAVAETVTETEKETAKED